MKSQSRNKRSNRIIEYMGEKKPLVEWCEQFGEKYGTVRTRLSRGWSINDALTK